MATSLKLPTLHIVSQIGRRDQHSNTCEWNSARVVSFFDQHVARILASVSRPQPSEGQHRIAFGSQDAQAPPALGASYPQMISYSGPCSAVTLPRSRQSCTPKAAIRNASQGPGQSRTFHYAPRSTELALDERIGFAGFEITNTESVTVSPP